MKLGEPLLKILSKTYPPSEMIDLTFGRYDLKIKTNESGMPILLFIGKKTDKGTIKGERFARTYTTSESGEVIKDHWDNKGKAG